MARTKVYSTKTEKGVIYTDRNGKRHLLNREEFHKLMEHLARRAKIEHRMKVIEDMEI